MLLNFKVLAAMYEGSDFSTCSLTFLFLGMCRKYIYYFNFGGILGISAGKEICLQCRRPQFDPWVGQIPWRRAWKPTPVFKPGESPWREEPGGL